MSPANVGPMRRWKVRGMEPMFVVLLLAIGVVATLALYFVLSQYIASTPAPAVQLDPYGSTFAGKQVVITLRIGTSIDAIQKVEVVDPTNPSNALCTVTSFTPSGPYRQGETVTGFGQCTYAPPRGIMYQVKVTYTAGGQSGKVVVLNWQT